MGLTSDEKLLLKARKLLSAEMERDGLPLAAQDVLNGIYDHSVRMELIIDALRLHPTDEMS